MPTFGSLFAGIGGFDLGLERAGWECAWQVEIDDYATKVLQKHWPNVTRFRDVRDCGKHNLTSVDLICGGFPCQDISYAGKRAGLSGKRSGLWFEFARIIGEIRPRWVLVENVPGLLSIDAGRGMGTILRDLAACGYDAEWDCIPAAALGAPHRRDRLWIVADAGRLRRDSWRPRESLQGARMESETSMAYANGKRCGKASERLTAPRIFRRSGLQEPNVAHPDRKPTLWITEPREERNPWYPEPRLGRLANGIPNRVDRLKCLGNAVVPQVAEWIGRRILAAHERMGNV